MDRPGEDCKVDGMVGAEVVEVSNGRTKDMAMKAGMRPEGLV